MGGNIISESIHLLLRHRHSVSLVGLYCCHYVVLFIYLFLSNLFLLAVCILNMKKRCVVQYDCIRLMLHFELINAPFIEKVERDIFPLNYKFGINHILILLILAQNQVCFQEFLSSHQNVAVP